MRAMDAAERARLEAKYAAPAFSAPRLTRRWLRDPRVGLLLVCLGAFLFHLSTGRIAMQRCDDFYIVVGARSLASGRGYRDISRPDAPPLLKYPPLRSLVLAPFVGLVDETIRPLRLLSMLFFTAGLPLAYLLLRPRIGHRAGLLCILLAALNPNAIRLLNLEGCLGLLFLLWLATFLALERSDTWPAGRAGLAIGGLLTLCFYTHRMGLVLAAGAGAYLLWRRRWLAALIALGLAALLSAPWMARSYRYSGHWISHEYESEISDKNQAGVAPHVWENLIEAPDRIGYGLLPWYRASGGAPWPALVRGKLTWVGPAGAWLLTGLTLLGWAALLRRERRFSEAFFPLQTLMLLLFFVGFQYYLMFYPLLPAWLWRGMQVLGRRWSPAWRRRIAWAGWSLLLLVSLAKDIRAFWLYPTGPDRDLRWRWIPQVVPPGEAVYYQGLENYAFAPLRWFDTGRTALGITDDEIRRAPEKPSSPIRYVCVARQSPLGAELKARGWRLVAYEDRPVATLAPERLAALSDAQRNFLRLQDPPQALWVRPAP